ncbi:acyl carrier protein [Pannus brasiliensis CCIBt3594]|uniref:Acyl carrier protein n=1 Tax=Pannus brasiliensis CCIBt3594 TaxID=1427578 RepID=A0AAW9QYK3_9CHRO
MITTVDIQAQTRQLILEVLPDVTQEDLENGLDIFSLGLDSINAMTLVSRLQDTFNIELDPSEISFENFQNVTAIVAMVEEKKKIVQF